MVDRFGRRVLLTYDQGTNYMTWTDLERVEPATIKEPELSLEQVLPVISAIYSSFNDMGGELRVEDLFGEQYRPKRTLRGVSTDAMSLNGLITTLFPMPKDHLVFWAPRYIPEKDRLKVLNLVG